jgi:hypothetical protein
MAFAFEKLLVYQKAVDFADHIAALTETFPRGYGFLADQLNRASLSIAANIAERNGRFTKAERKDLYTIGRGLAGVLGCRGGVPGCLYWSVYSLLGPANELHGSPA